MSVQIPFISYINGDDQKYASAFRYLGRMVSNLSNQANADPTTSQVASPPAVSGVNVVEQGGIHDIQIADNSPAYNGRRYSAYYSQNADMSNAHRIDMGESQNHRANLGAGTYYWGATTKQGNSDESPMVFHGGAQPAAVGSGSYPGPPMQAPQSFSGLYRNATTPPVRK
jgi:hypothetical protein